ncbi:MAG: hypothetical protein ACYDC2_08760 [Solirubrobacteraceae bacterium]
MLLMLVGGGLAVAALVLHIPDLGAASGFLRGGHPSGVAALAAATLLIWVALLAGALVVLVRSARHVRTTVPSAPVVVVIMIVVGVAILGVGVVRHSTAASSYSMCCGSISQARQQLASAP